MASKNKNNGRIRKVPGARRIRKKELPSFTRQLAALLSSGIPVIKSLDAMHDQTTNPSLKKVIEGLRSQIEQGASVSESLALYPDIFDELFVGTIHSGESSGALAETMERLAVYLAKAARLRSKVKSAMMYPVIVSLVCLILTVGMIIGIVPVFAEIYADFDAALPLPTRILVTLSEILRSQAPYVGGGLAVAVFLFIRFKRTENGGIAWDEWKLHAPVFGDLMCKISLSRFASTFAQLTRSGVPILNVLDISATAMGNKYFGKTIRDSKAVVERGEPLSSALFKNKNFPRMFVHMMSTGEQTGQVDSMIQNIADFYDEEVDTTLTGLTSLIEPLLIVFLGTVIGGIVVCMFMPIFKMHEIVNF
ncbi:type II secretion system F family protein [PVC group bacterium]|nr:type II secretion system F family protein [PVC group bacterium]